MATKNHSSIFSLALLVTLVVSPLASIASTQQTLAQESSPAPTAPLNGTPPDARVTPSPLSPSSLEGLIPISLLLLLGGGLWFLKRRETESSFTSSSTSSREGHVSPAAPQAEPAPVVEEDTPTEEDAPLIPPIVPPAPAVDLPPVLPTDMAPPAVGLPPAGVAIAGAGGVMGIVGAGMSPDLSEVDSEVEMTDEVVSQEPEVVSQEPEVIPQEAEVVSQEPDEPPSSLTDESLVDPTLTAGTAIVAGKILSPLPNYPLQSDVEAARYEVGQTNDAMDDDTQAANPLASVDDSLPDLPTGYGESRIVLMARDPQWAYAYWDISNEHKEAVRREGGTRLALRFCDVTDLNIKVQKPHTIQQYECEEIAQDWYLPVPISDREYLVEIGYLTEDGRWLMLARSTPVRIPPIYGTDWSNEQFLTVNWEDHLEGQTLVELEPPKPSPRLHDTMYSLSLNSEAQRSAGSIYGSMQAISSYGLVSGSGMSGIGMSGSGMSGIGMSGSGMSGVGMSGIGMSGVGMSGVGMSGVGMSGIGMSGVGMSGVGMSGVGMFVPTMSGVGMSGVGMSGIGFASMPPIRPRKFWLVANAELIVYGATEPDATVTIGGQTIKLNPDGTFRFHLAFPDGRIDFPIFAVAADGIQTRSVEMRFNRETPEQNTNTKDEATDEWFT